MPKLSHSVPKYRKHRATGQAVVTLNGRDHYLGPHGTQTSRMEYDRLVQEWLSRGRTAELNDYSITVVELISAYMKWARQHYRKNGNLTASFAGLKSAFRLLKRLYGRTPATSFGPKRLKALRMKMQETEEVDHRKRKVKRLSRNTINAHCATIRRLFRWAASEEYIPASIPQALAMLPGLQRGRSNAPESKPVLPVDDATVDATLARLSPVVADMVRLQRFTGMRPAEVCVVRPQDVDTTGEVWLYRPQSHKTEHHGHQRVICIGPQGQVILRPYLLRESSAFCFCPADSERKRRREQFVRRVTPLSCGNRPGTKRVRNPNRAPGDRYTPDSYRRAIKRATEAAKVNRWHPNQLRHSAATNIRAKFGLEAAQVTLGHSKADVTQVYAERDLGKAIEVARLIG